MGSTWGALRPPQAPWHPRGTLSLEDTAAAAQLPAKSRINPNGRGYRGPGTSAPSRVATPAPVPKSTFPVHVRVPASRASLRLLPPEPVWLRRVGGPLPGGKFCARPLVNPPSANAVSPLRRTGSVSPLPARRARLGAAHWGHRPGASPGAQGLGKKQPRTRTMTAQRQNGPSRLHAGGGVMSPCGLGDVSQGQHLPRAARVPPTKQFCLTAVTSGIQSDLLIMTYKSLKDLVPPLVFSAHACLRLAAQPLAFLFSRDTKLFTASGPLL